PLHVRMPVHAAENVHQQGLTACGLPCADRTEWGRAGNHRSDDWCGHEADILCSVTVGLPRKVGEEEVQNESPGLLYRLGLGFLRHTGQVAVSRAVVQPGVGVIPRRL